MSPTIAKLDPDKQTVTIRVPMRFERRGGRKVVIAPSDGEVQQGWRVSSVDSALVKAVSRAFRWQTMLESGDHQTVSDLAKAEKINPSYLARILRLTLLAPDIVEAILDGRQSGTATLKTLRQPFSVEWEKQKLKLA